MAAQFHLFNLYQTNLYPKPAFGKIGVMKQSRFLFILLHIFLYTTHHVSAQPLDNNKIVAPSDYHTLKAIQHELVDHYGILSSWNNSTNAVCSGGWVGIKCSNGRVIAIQLPWKGLTGKISEKIGNLRALRKLSLHDNALTGSIPNSIGLLTNLRGVYLFNNEFSGSVPSSIGNCKFLQALDFSNNSLMGAIPSSVVNSSRIFRLNLSFNFLSGSIPFSFTQSKSLMFLSLQYNNLTGSVPDHWGETGKGEINGSQLQSLNLYHNSLSGSIPVSLSTISGLTQLDLSENKFTGEISGSFGNLTKLEIFNVSYNNLSGIVPSNLSKKFNSSSFAGNAKLCGYISSPCLSPSPSPSPSAQTNISSPPFEPNTHHHRKPSTKDIILIASGVLLLILLLLCCILLCFLLRKRFRSSKQRNGGKSERPVVAAGGAAMGGGGGQVVESGGDSGGRLVHFDGLFVFTADDLLCATAEIMGKSTYGTAYKATLEDGHQVAVKRLREKSTKGVKEFENEVSELGKIRHENILALRAYYAGPKGEKLLVFDFMSNGSLASFLHARGPETLINWATRMKIMIGIAHGLKYLHTEKNIVHENLTSSNILLDDHSNPHIAEVGLSRLMTNAANTNMIATAGSTGYRAPELSKLKKANNKTDIYSLGVLILELLTGKSPSDGMNGLGLPQWVASIVKEEWTNEVFDLELMKNESNINDELLNTLNLALHCVDPSPDARPDVTQVVKQLEEIIKPE